MKDEYISKNNYDRKKTGGFIKDFLLPTLTAIVIIVILRTFLIGIYYIPSGSMIPTLDLKDHVVVNKLAYHFSEPTRGDIVVFKFPPQEKERQTKGNILSRQLANFLPFIDSSLKEVDYVKRLIALPGEEIKIENNKVYIDEVALDETYIAQDTMMPDFGPIKLGEDEYFMLGDNRNHSNDSRYWGTVEREFLIGKVKLLYWPLDNWKVMR